MAADLVVAEPVAAEHEITGVADRLRRVALAEFERRDASTQALAKRFTIRGRVAIVDTAGAQGQFDKTIEALTERSRREPNNPEAFYFIGTFFWEKAYRDFTLKESQKREYVAKGMEAIDKAMALKPDYMEAITYKNLLLRSQALLEKDPKVQQALLKEADQFRDRATQLQKKKVAGVGGN